MCSRCPRRIVTLATSPTSEIMAYFLAALLEVTMHGG